jgi:hypothetical protein
VPAQQQIEDAMNNYRLLDGDDNIVFEGETPIGYNDENSFEPFDRRASSLGATSIEYFIDGKWVGL